MVKRILIDAFYPYETRVAILDNNHLLEFDYETKVKAQHKGNIYLAKVTRVEPSLQAAFLDYGGGRHGFMPFSEIHPDYYQIPVADRKLLEEAHAAEIAAEAPVPVEPTTSSDDGEETMTPEEPDTDDEASYNGKTLHAAYMRKYKIQEVIKRGQILLVQVIKEERGNKGASLTTFISLAGRYCVLMPNSERQGGVSRRITDGEDRRRLRDLIEQLGVPRGTSVIVRTAGGGHTKADIRRDYDYLVRLWNSIREHTLKSIAPAFIHAEGDVIKRCIRDMYTAGMDEILIQGGDAYRSAKEFMKLIMPSHVAKVKLYDSKVPLFHRHKVEDLIAHLYSMQVTLPSGGYIVINPTEALISIDVNSGKNTTERNVEETAHKTNLEAAHEIARQLRLRDLSGLIVIDFIDMSETRHRIQVERAMRDAMHGDRAKIQLGRISVFGLLELSRQRLRPSFFEANNITCEHCHGKGIVRAPESLAIMALRTVQNELAAGDYEALTLFASIEAVLYILNHKRKELAVLEEMYQTHIQLQQDPECGAGIFAIEKTKRSQHSKPAESLSKIEGVQIEEVLAEEAIDAPQVESEEPAMAKEEPPRNNRRRNWRQRERTIPQGEAAIVGPTANEAAEVVAESLAYPAPSGDVDENAPAKRRSRSRRRPPTRRKAAAADGETPAEQQERAPSTRPKQSGAQEHSANEPSLLREIWKRIVE
jgi:ribonuclease E